MRGSSILEEAQFRYGYHSVEDFAGGTSCEVDYNYDNGQSPPPTLLQRRTQRDGQMMIIIIRKVPSPQFPPLEVGQFTNAPDCYYSPEFRQFSQVMNLSPLSDG